MNDRVQRMVVEALCNWYRAERIGDLCQAHSLMFQAERLWIGNPGLWN